jgi:hypothetical protein
MASSKGGALVIMRVNADSSGGGLHGITLFYDMQVALVCHARLWLAHIRLERVCMPADIGGH